MNEAAPTCPTYGAHRGWHEPERSVQFGRIRAALIAAAPTLLAELADEVERLRKIDEAARQAHRSLVATKMCRCCVKGSKPCILGAALATDERGEGT